MNKKIMKAVMAIAIVFLVAAMPISGMIGNGIVGMAKADEQAAGIIGNVAPFVKTAMTTGGDLIVYNSGSDTLTFNASTQDRNREDDIGDVDDTPSGCWFNISSATTGNFTNYNIKIAATSLSSSQANMYNATANDGILVLSSTTNDATNGFQWTCPASWLVATDYIANLTIRDNDGETCYTTITFEVKSAVKIIGIYNYTGPAVDKDSPFYWNFTSTYPGTLNVTSGNMSYSYSPESPGTNYGYNNATGREWSYWLVVNNTGGISTQAFNVSFSEAGFTSTTTSGTPIPTSNYIRFEYYRTSILTYANNDTAGSGAEPSVFSGTTAYIADGNTKYGITGDTTDDARVRFTFDAGSQNIWIRFMVDTPDPCRDATDYTCTYAVLGG